MLVLILLLIVIIYYLQHKKTASFDTPVVRLHYTNWCPWCKKMKPIWEESKKSLGNIIHFEENDEDIQKTSGIAGYPTILLHSQGRVYKYDGKLDVNHLNNWIKEHIN